MPAGDSKNDDERARRAAAELKETEDLLAGFDRPGRTPRVPPVKRDFVDYHLEKRRSSPAPQPSPVPGRAGRDLPTAIIPGHKRTLPAWLPWAGLLLVMSVLGVLVAAALSGPPINPASATTSSSLTSAATTLASATPTFEPTSGPARDIPPPPPSTSTSEATSDTASAAASAPVLTATGTTVTAAPTTTTDSTARPGPSTPTPASTPRRPPAPASATAMPAPSPAPTAPPAPTTTASAAVDLIRNL